MNNALTDHFTKTLEEFPFDAPRGTCDVDRYIETLARFRRSTVNIDVVRLRKGLWRAAYLAYLNETDQQQLPGWRKEAEKLLAHLGSVTASLQAASHIDSAPIFRTLVFIPDDPKELAQHLSRQMVEREYYRLNSSLGMAHNRIIKFLERNVLPPKKKGSNAADRFMRSFIETSKMVWEREIDTLASRDQKAFSCLLFDALANFGYTRARDIRCTGRTPASRHPAPHASCNRHRRPAGRAGTHQRPPNQRDAHACSVRCCACFSVQSFGTSMAGRAPSGFPRDPCALLASFLKRIVQRAIAMRARPARRFSEFGTPKNPLSFHLSGLEKP